AALASSGAGNGVDIAAAAQIDRGIAIATGRGGADSIERPARAPSGGRFAGYVGCMSFGEDRTCIAGKSRKRTTRIATSAADGALGEENFTGCRRRCGIVEG